MKKVLAQGLSIYTFKVNEEDFISLTNIAQFKDKERTDYIIQNWMRNRDTIEFLGIWEKLNNPDFKPIEFDGFKNQAGSNSFSLTPKKWIESVNAIGLVTRSGRYNGGTFAHKDIAFEFATWISPEFKLYLIKEFQRLKNEEKDRLSLGWDVKRHLTKINYRIHTDAIQQNIVMPKKLSASDARFTYASEADILNKALYGMTASEWKEQNKEKDGNIRDHSDVYQLICLANLESLNAEFIKMGMSQSERLMKLNEIAIVQMKSLLSNNSIRNLGA